MAPSRGKLATTYLLGMASLLVLGLLAGSAMLWPPERAIAGDARPATTREVAATPDVPPRPEAADEHPKTAPPPEESAEPASAPQTDVPGQRPGTIRLPDGGTATLVRKEVQGPNAVLPVPEDLTEATWWGAGLGAPHGASVFAGHVNFDGRVGPFAELWHTEVHDEITVLDSAGKAWHYRVSQVLTLHKDDLPSRSAALFSQDGQHRIVLVTCGGRWLGGTTGYAQNRMVVAEPSDS